MTAEPASNAPEGQPGSARTGSVAEVAALFFKLGCIGFGGPAAHIAMMRAEVVERRKWLSDEEFLDLLGATNLIPGPNSTELAIHLGYRRAGWAGLVAAGVLFISPAMAIVLALAWAYMAYGSLPQTQWLLYGVKPVIIAIVLQALSGLGRTAFKQPLSIVLTIAVIALYLWGVNELALLFGGGLAMLVIQGGRKLTAKFSASALALVAPASSVPPALSAVTAMATPFSLITLFLTFLKIGSVLYGSGYVLLAFLRGDLVERLGWLTDQQLLDAVSVGQFTPGPVFTTATFVGYVAGYEHSGLVMGGITAALLATLGIFLPSFVFVAISGPLVPHLRRWTVTALLLNGVNAAALGLMAAVTLVLARAALLDPFTVVLAIAALVVLLRWNVNSGWIVLAGGMLGIAWRFGTLTVSI